MCCSDAEANAGDYGDADTGGAADIVRWSAAGFVEDGGGGPECAFIWFLHEGVGDAIFAIGCGGEDGDEFGQCLEIFLPLQKRRHWVGKEANLRSISIRVS